MLKIVQNQVGVFDLAFDDPTLNDEDAAVATLVYAVLCGDAEAPASRVADRTERRGWWANPTAGSGLWHIRRQPLGSAARAETLAMVVKSLTDHGLSQVEITELDGLAGNVSRVQMRLAGAHNGRQFLLKVPL